MALPTSGSLSLAQIQTEFGGDNPIQITEYYRGGAYTTTNNTNVPTSGQISVGQFYGAQRLTVIPASGSVSQYFNLQYSYGNPAVISWSRSGNTLNWSITSYTTYCGSAKSGSGQAAITTKTVNGYLVETASFAFGHPKDCCNGNQNYVTEYYTMTMNYPNSLIITASSTAGGQSGC